MFNIISILKIEITFTLYQIHFMKRISFDTISTARDTPVHYATPLAKSCQDKETKIKIQETVPLNSTKTEQSTIFNFSNRLFGECFPSALNDIKQYKTYHKLRHHSQDKNTRQKQQKFNSDKKTMSLNDSIVSFGKEKIIVICNDFISRSKNKCLIKDVSSSSNQQKCNGLNWTLSTQRQTVNSSMMNPISEIQTKYLNTYVEKLFLSQDFKNSQNIKDEQGFKKQQNMKIIPQQIKSYLSISQDKKISQDWKNIQNTRRLSTIDSIKIKQNQQNEKSQMNNPVDFGAILCESIKIKEEFSDQKNNNKQKAFQFDHMKDSLINKLNFSKKEDSFIDSKRKSFLRSKRNTKLNQQSPKFCDLQLNNRNQKSNNYENEEQYQPTQQKILKKKFKNLDQCGYTIVSKYNNSSDIKSILQQSNIVFQASKMCEEPLIQNIKYPTFSDSQIQFKDNKQNQKIYNSFIHQIDFQQKSGIQMADSDDKLIGSKKMKNNFLRTKKTQSQRQINANDERDIRFDLDVFIQYEPI